jgi:hypothetical protein
LPNQDFPAPFDESPKANSQAEAFRHRFRANNRNFFSLDAEPKFLTLKR